MKPMTAKLRTFVLACSIICAAWAHVRAVDYVDFYVYIDAKNVGDVPVSLQLWPYASRSNLVLPSSSSGYDVQTTGGYPIAAPVGGAVENIGYLCIPGTSLIQKMTRTSGENISIEYSFQVAVSKPNGGSTLFTKHVTYHQELTVSVGMANPRLLLTVKGEEVELCDAQKLYRGDPFNALTGAVISEETDLVLPGPGLPLSVSRSYNSKGPGSSEFGPGWSLSEKWTLHVNDNVTGWASGSTPYTWATDGDGRRIGFHKTSDTNWFTDNIIRAQLAQQANGEFDLVRQDDRLRMHFDSSGRWLWTEDGWTNRVTAQLNGSGNITNLAHSCGRSITLSWTGSRVTSLTDSAGQLSATFAYNPSGVLTSAVRQAASGEQIVRNYTYTTAGLLASKTDGAGQTVSHVYDSSQRCITNQFSDGTYAAYAAWNTGGGSVDITYPCSTGTVRGENVAWFNTETNNGNGVYWNISYGSYSLDDGWVPGAPGDTRYIHFLVTATNTTYPSRLDYTTSLPRVARITEGAETLCYHYSPAGISETATAMVWSVGAQTAAVWRVMDAWQRPVETHFSLNNGVPVDSLTTWTTNLDLPASQTDPLGWRTEYTWTNGLPTLVRQTNALGGWCETALVWSQGLLQAVSDPLGNITTLGYDSQGSVIRIEPPVGPVATFSNDALGNAVTLCLPGEDNENRQWQFLRDGFGRITNAVDPDGLGTRLSLDAVGHVTNIVDRAGRRTAIQYGAMGKPLQYTRTITENGVSRDIVVNISRNLQMEPVAIRDASNRTVEAYSRNNAGRVDVVTNIEGRTATATYGVLGLPQTVTRFDATQVTFGYNSAANVISLAFPGRTNAFAWLANGLPAAAANEQSLVTNTWIAPGWLTSQQTRTAGWTGQVDYASDLSGAITQVTAGAIGLSATQQFDAGGRETNRTQICGNAALASACEYGAWNGLPTHVTVDSVQQTLGWDKLNRLTNITWQVQGQTIRGIRFSYDVLGQILQRVDTVAGVEKTRSYTYDGLDRLVSETHADGFSAAFSFDDVGRRTAKSTAEFDVNYANGDGDRLARWNVSRTNLAVSVAGHASEPIGTNAQIGMGQVYNSAGSATPTISGTNFTATLQAEALGTQTVVVLISDVAGNVGVTTNRHVLTAYTTGAYSGDAAGCVTQIVYQGPLCEQSRVLAWDAEYRLTSVKTNGATAETHTYDPYGRRISTTDADGAVTRYLNDGVHVLADLDATGGVLRTYFYGPNVDELLAMTVHTGVVAQTYYAIRDHQNTIWAWVNTNGAVVESYDFDAWGRLLSVIDGNGNALESSAIGNRYMFQGREYSWATGLYYFRARWYDPVTGRWLSPDPIGINGGLNQYVFCSNNPVNFTDPTGKSYLGAALITIGGIVIAVQIWDVAHDLNNGGIENGNLAATFMHLFTIHGRNYNSLSPATKWVIDQHEAVHRKWRNNGEKCAYKQSVSDIDKLLSAGVFNGNPLTAQERDDLSHLREQSLKHLFYDFDITVP